MLYKTRTTSGNRATPREPRQSAAGTGGRSGDSNHDSDNGGPEAPASNTIGTGWLPQTGHCPSLGSLVVLRARGGRPIPRARKSQWTKRGNQVNWRETGNRAAMGNHPGCGDPVVVANQRFHHRSAHKRWPAPPPITRLLFIPCARKCEIFHTRAPQPTQPAGSHTGTGKHGGQGSCPRKTTRRCDPVMTFFAQIAQLPKLPKLPKSLKIEP